MIGVGGDGEGVGAKSDEELGVDVGDEGAEIGFADPGFEGFGVDV